MSLGDTKEWNIVYNYMNYRIISIIPKTPPTRMAVTRDARETRQDSRSSNC